MSESSTPVSRGPPSRLRWFRFSLRTMLVIAPLIAIGLGLGIRQWYASYVERRAVAEVERLGGKVVRNEGGEVISVELPGAGINDETLRLLVPHLQHLPELKSLVLVSNEVTDAGVVLLADVPQLEVVYLAGTKVSSGGIAALQARRPKLTIDYVTPNPAVFRLASRDIFGHAILRLAMSPDRRLVGGDGNGRVLVWDLETEQVLNRVQAHEEWTFDVAFHPTGKWLATAGGDNLIKLWTWPELEEAGRFVGHEDDVHAIAFTADGQTLVSAGDDMVARIWDVATRRQQHVLEGHEGTIPDLAISADGAVAATASRDGTVRLWSIARGEQLAVLAEHADDVMAVDFHPCGHELATASYDGTVIVWNVAERQPLRTLAAHEDWAFGVRYSSTGDDLMSTAGDGVAVWNAETGRLRWRSADQRNVADAIWLKPDLAATSSADGSVAIWDRSDGANVAMLWTSMQPKIAGASR